MQKLGGVERPLEKHNLLTEAHFTLAGLFQPVPNILTVFTAVLIPKGLLEPPSKVTTWDIGINCEIFWKTIWNWASSAVAVKITNPGGEKEMASTVWTQDYFSFVRGGEGVWDEWMKWINSDLEMLGFNFGSTFWAERPLWIKK